jgi:hypothetical protein
VVNQDFPCRISHPQVLNFVAECVFLLRMLIKIEEPRDAPLFDCVRSLIKSFAHHLPVFPLDTENLVADIDDEAIPVVFFLFAHQEIKLIDSIDRAVRGHLATRHTCHRGEDIHLVHNFIADSAGRYFADYGSVPIETRSMFVEPLPSVTTVVFICTPHRGSFVAEDIFGKIGRRLVSFPGTLTKVSVDLGKLDPEAAKQALTLPTAIDNMDGSNPFIKTLSALPITPGVDSHSIIAVKGDGPPEKGDDGGG